MFYDIFESLCRKRGVTPNRACIDMGLSRSIAAKWKNTQANPSADVLPKIAEYFAVTTDFLLGSEQKEKDPARISDEDIKFALFGRHDVSDKAFEDVKRFARFINEGNGNEDNN